MHEEEAKTKWCPWAQQSEENYGSYNRLMPCDIPQQDPNLPLHSYLYTNDAGIIDSYSVICGTPGCRVLYVSQPTRAADACLCLTTRCMAWVKQGLNHGYCVKLKNT